MAAPEEQRAIWVCPACGSDEIEGLAWVDLNTEQIESWDEGAAYWCPRCEEDYKRICQVDAEGKCLIHSQPLTVCRG